MSQQLSQNLQLDLMPNTRDQENLYDINKLYNAVKIVMAALDAYTGVIGAEADDYDVADTTFILAQNTARLYRQAAETISAGNTVSLDSSGNFIKGTVGTVVGWAPATINSGEYGEIRLFGLCNSIGGMTPGVAYYASATAGLVTNTATAQKIGIALSATKLFFNPS